ncbi:IS607 family element transposase accessory protein TnpB [Nocardia tengchongensis]|uniref:IS607 family element transposase accessory protein TnpB n=1 Tax=Nocardia tengchongensis TaxID=2055889 RepID=A0ABX8CFY8_9NOCA|nr:IS607 family element RNA-guided endonuclease TnpB [Nocardia tengchongensis]QVI18888.1 IS607 family element transposase accessory protein TnpB [Nocardia tengchongensis]
MSEFGTVALPPDPSTEMKVQAYRFALDPTPDQQESLRSHCGAARFAYNWGRQRVFANWNQRIAEASYDIPNDDLTPWIDVSSSGLRKAWNAEKGNVAPWWAENSKEAYSSGLTRLADAFANYGASKRGLRAGARMGVPRRRKKYSHQSFTVTTGSYGLGAGSRRLKIPRIGVIRTAESTRKLARRLRNGTAKLGAMTLSYRTGRWFASFTVRVRRDDPTPARPKAVVGVDVGVKSLAVLSTGEVLRNPKHYQKVQQKRRRLARARSRRNGPDRKRGIEPSKRWMKANAAANHLEYRVTAMSRDSVHKLTTRLATKYGTVVVEHLNVAGMLRNRSLSKAIWSTRLAELRRQLEYKACWYSTVLVKADRYFPSSKTCSACKAVKAKLSLNERVFRCDHCGLVLDRDVNAARNLAALASSASCVGTVKKPAGNRVGPGSPGSGIATGRPETTVTGQPCLSNLAGHGTRRGPL